MRLILSLSLIILVSGCTSKASPAPPPTATVVNFLQVSMDENTTVEEYIAKVDPFLSDAALSQTEAKLLEAEQVFFKNSDIEVKNATVADDLAEVEVSYTMTVANSAGSNEYTKTLTFDLSNTSGQWEITE